MSTFPILFGDEQIIRDYVRHGRRPNRTIESNGRSKWTNFRTRMRRHMEPYRKSIMDECGKIGDIRRNYQEIDFKGDRIKHEDYTWNEDYCAYEDLDIVDIEMREENMIDTLQFLQSENRWDFQEVLLFVWWFSRTNGDLDNAIVFFKENQKEIYKELGKRIDLI